MAVAAVSVVMIGMVRPAVASRVVSPGVMSVARATVSFAVVVFHAVMVAVCRVLARVMLAPGVGVAVRRTAMLRTTTELRTDAVRAMAFGAGVDITSGVGTETARSARTAVKLRSTGEAMMSVKPEVLRTARSAVAEARSTGEAVRSAMFEHAAELMPAVVLRGRLLCVAAGAARGGIASGFMRRVFLVARRWAASLFQSLLESLQSTAQLLIFGFEFLDPFFGVAGCGLRRRRELRCSDKRES